MLLHHVEIMNVEEGRAVRFYRDILGLEKIKESSVSTNLAGQLFSIDQEIRMLDSH